MNEDTVFMASADKGVLRGKRGIVDFGKAEAVFYRIFAPGFLVFTRKAKDFCEGSGLFCP